MKKRLLPLALSLGMLAGSAEPALAVTYRHYHHYSNRYVRHKRHMATARRVGIGAAGGAAVGAIAGGGKGAGIGALVGAGAGALYDRHEKHHGHY
jgi:hypothetical protein